MDTNVFTFNIDIAHKLADINKNVYLNTKLGMHVDRKNLHIKNLGVYKEG